MIGRKSKKYIIELDGKFYAFTRNRLEEIDGLDEIKGDRCFVSDLQDSISRVMTVDVAPKYADILVRKNLQESGEFDDAVAVIPFWRKGKGKNTTDIFFSAFPADLSAQYLDLGSTHEDNVLLLPLYAVLLGVLQRMQPKKPVAVVFQHGRYADLLIGTKDRVYSANRNVAFDSGEEHLLSLWENVKEDLKSTEDINRIKVAQVYLLTWVDSIDPVEWSRDPERDVVVCPGEAVTYNGERHVSSFLKNLRRLSVMKSVSSPADKMLYLTRRLAPAFNIVCFLCICALIGATSFMLDQTRDLEQQISKVTGRADSIRIAPPLEINQEELKQTVQFVKDLTFIRNAPSYKRIINELSNAFPDNMILEILKIGYSTGDLQLEMFGHLDTSFEHAHREYRTFESRLKRKGYSIVKSQFDTELKKSKFLLTLSKKIL